MSIKYSDTSDWTLKGNVAYLTKVYRGKELKAIIDATDLSSLYEFSSFSIVKRHKTFYVECKKQKNGYEEKEYLHRFLMKLSRGERKVVDHEDGNGLNNRRENLRVCTHPQNSVNKSLRKDNKSGYKGVFKKGKRFMAQISFQKKIITLGTFDTAIAAAAAYDKKAKELYGEFAKLNGV